MNKSLILSLLCLELSGGYVASKESSSPQVNFVNAEATPLEAIKAVALQTEVPIGIVFGENQQLLCSTKQAFNIQATSPIDSLIEASKASRYSVQQEGGVLVILAPDITPLQRESLDHHFESFSAGDGSTMAGLGAQLTGWLWMQTGVASGFASSTLHSTTAKKYDLGNISSATTRQIANRIVSLDDKGVWVFKTLRTNHSEPAKQVVQILSYKEDQQLIMDISCSQ